MYVHISTKGLDGKKRQLPHHSIHCTCTIVQLKNAENKYRGGLDEIRYHQLHANKIMYDD